MVDVVDAFEIEAREAAGLGFSPGAMAVQIAWDGQYALIGMSADRSRVFSPPNSFIKRSGRLVPSAKKVYNSVGMVDAIDLHAPSMRQFRATVGTPVDVDRMMRNLRRRVAVVLGSELVHPDGLPGEMRVINAALAHKAAGRREHARLTIQWSWLHPWFSETPKLLDRVIGGESIWNLVPVSVNEVTLKELRRMKSFSASWARGGIGTERYLERLVEAVGHLPEGGIRPTNALDANSLVDLVAFAQRWASPSLLQQIVAKTENWIGAEPFVPGHAKDFIDYVRNVIIRDAFLVNGNADPFPEDNEAAFKAVIGLDMRAVVKNSAEWHSRFFNGAARAASLGTNLRDTAPQWASAIDPILVPPFETLDTPPGRKEDDVYIVPLDSVEDLAVEGDGQHHCVLSYRRSCAEGRLRVVSIRRGGVRGKTLSTLAFKIGGGEVVATEHRSFANGEPSMAAQAAVKWFVRQCNSGRPPFRFNTTWPYAAAVGAEGLRPALLANFEQMRPFLAKKVRKGGFSALMKVCGVKPRPEGRPTLGQELRLMRDEW